MNDLGCLAHITVGAVTYWHISEFTGTLALLFSRDGYCFFVDDSFQYSINFYKIYTLARQAFQ